MPFLYAVVDASSTNLSVTIGAVGTPILSTVTQWPTTDGVQVLQ